MNWASLLLAVVFGVPAAIMLIRHKLPRVTGILFALAALCILAGIPSLLARLGHPLGPGPILLIIVGGAIGFALFFWFDVVRVEHKKPLFGRKAIGGTAGQPGAGAKVNHHVRPMVASVGLAVFGLMIAMNWHAVITGTGSGFSQTVNTITHQQS